jgi:hypothetical protein
LDPISYVIKIAGSPMNCNDIAPPPHGKRWEVSGIAGTLS